MVDDRTVSQNGWEWTGLVELGRKMEKRKGNGKGMGEMGNERNVETRLAGCESWLAKALA